MKEDENERLIITYKEAIKKLPKGDEIHTFRSPNGGMLIGTDWERKTILKLLKASKEIHVTGEMAQKMNHGIAVKDKYGWLFIATKDVAGVKKGEGNESRQRYGRVWKDYDADAERPPCGVA